MTITTKYDIGQEVWFYYQPPGSISEEEVSQGIISEIRYDGRSVGYQIVTVLDYYWAKEDKITLETPAKTPLEIFLLQQPDIDDEDRREALRFINRLRSKNPNRQIVIPGK
jgi:hypothetical protein